MRSSRLESGFQDRLIDILKTRLPGCLTFKLDRQGFPDLLVLYRDKWAALECKRTISAHKHARLCKQIIIKGGCVIQPPYYYVLLAVKASRRKSRTLRIGLSPLPFLWTAVAGSIIIIVSFRNSYSSFLCYLACVSLSAGLLHSPLPTLALKSPSTILFHGGYVQIAGNSQQEVIAPNRYSILCLLVKLSKSC